MCIYTVEIDGLCSIYRVPLVELLRAVFASKKPKANQRGGNQKLLFQKQLLLGSTVLKAPWTLLLAFGFLLFAMVKIESCFTVVSRKIEIGGKLYLFEPNSLQLFHSPQPTATFPQPTAHSSFFRSHSSTKHTLIALSAKRLLDTCL